MDMTKYATNLPDHSLIMSTYRNIRNSFRINLSIEFLSVPKRRVKGDQTRPSLSPKKDNLAFSVILKIRTLGAPV